MEIAERAVKTIFHSFSVLEVLSLQTLSLFCSRLADSKSISNLFRNLSPRLLVVPSRGREVIQIDCLTENGSFNPQGEVLRLRSARYCVSQFQNSFHRSFRKASRRIQSWQDLEGSVIASASFAGTFNLAASESKRLPSRSRSVNFD